MNSSNYGGSATIVPGSLSVDLDLNLNKVTVSSCSQVSGSGISELLGIGSRTVCSSSSASLHSAPETEYTYELDPAQAILGTLDVPR